jgi:hypothetical protein
MLDVRMVVAQPSGVQLTRVLPLAKKLHDEKSEWSAESMASIPRILAFLPFCPENEAEGLVCIK